MATALEWAKAALLFEGEGSIIQQRNHGKPAAGVRLKLKMTDEDVVRWFHSVVGCGSVIYGEREREHWKDTWLWSVYSSSDPAKDHCREILQHFMPHLKTRRHAAAVAALETLDRIQAARAARTPACGTPGGYHRHWRSGEKACVACLEAIRLRGLVCHSGKAV